MLSIDPASANSSRKAETKKTVKSDFSRQKTGTQTGRVTPPSPGAVWAPDQRLDLPLENNLELSSQL